MWIKTKVKGKASRLINSDSYDEIMTDLDDLSIVAVSCGFNGTELTIKMYLATNPSIEDLEKKMAKIERCFRDGRGFCDLDGEA
jgi:hypothetical protein